MTATAFVFLAYCVGNIIGPHAFLASEAPIYQTGCKVIMGCVAGQVVIAAVLRMVLMNRNKKRESEMIAAGQELSEEVIDDALLDLTDFENKTFRYSY